MAICGVFSMPYIVCYLAKRTVFIYFFKEGFFMIILSVFDGMSCGQIALNELGYSVTKYYSSEIDKPAIKQTQHNFKNTIQLGSVTDIKAKDLDKIDLFIGGSPCQGFSFAGKQLNFDDPRSVLFFEYVRLWKEIKAINPNAKFLLENVNMKKEYLRVISEYLGVFPVRINSNLVSAQNRDRWYWTNIKTKETGLFSELWSDIPQPEDKGILLKDILQPENEISDKFYLSEAATEGLLKHKERADSNGWGFGAKLHNGNDKFNAVKVGGTGKDDIYCVPIREVRSDAAKKQRRETGTNNFRQKDIEIRDDGKIAALQTSLTLEHNLLRSDFKLRRITPIECARLQTIPEWYKWIVSDTQIYKMLGNGWTVEIIKHIFSFLNGFEKTTERGQKNKKKLQVTIKYLCCLAFFKPNCIKYPVMCFYYLLSKYRFMKYMGSKDKISREIKEIIDLNRTSLEQAYIEPMVGGANMIDKMKGKRIAGDNNKYLIALWKGLQADLTRPKEITKQMFINAKQDFKNNTNAFYSDFMIGYIGFLGAYNGIFFTGYAGEVETKTGIVRNYAKESISNIENQLRYLKNVDFYLCDYKQILTPNQSVIYCDIPYFETSKYITSDMFNHSEFYDWAELKHKEGHQIFISEYYMPEDRFKKVWTKKVSSNLSQQTQTKIESLFIPKNQIINQYATLF